MLRCHVVALTPDLSQVLAICTPAGWLLPCLESNLLPAALPGIQAMLDGLATVVDIIHVAPLSLGSPALSDAYGVALVSGELRSDAVQRVPRSVLRTTSPLLPIQQRALTTSLRRLQTPGARFDSAAAVSAALEWANQQIAEQTGVRLLTMSRHRCGRQEYVVRLETTAGLMYFKGGPERVADEAVLTSLLWSRHPHQFPATIAIDLVNERWLYRALDGEPLIGALLTSETAARAAAALALLQKDVLGDARVREHLAGRQMNAVQIFQSADGIVRQAWLLSQTPANDRLVERERWSAMSEWMLDTCASIDDLGLPMTLVFSDFWTRNVLCRDDGIGFIDVEHSYWSYPGLSLWRFIKDVDSQLTAQKSGRVSIESAFISAWADLIPAADMACFLRRLPFLGTLFSMLVLSHELDLEERALGAVSTPVYRATRLSGHVRSILRMIQAGHD